ncbi:2-oxoglutarate and iron-dependent oxygenase domain-containing protein [Roseomonas mucosa]|uniref:2-oxoglutarate and iron-dependent oxygenase domain-containing protein n=1 Tax=Roseomonas mucosa TaxID=207340 RepID=UPI0014477C2F
MTSSPIREIPVLDLAAYRRGDAGSLEATAGRLREICETVGFLYIVNHGVPAALIEKWRCAITTRWTTWHRRCCRSMLARSTCRRATSRSVATRR